LIERPLGDAESQGNMPDTVARSFRFYRLVIWGAGLIAASVGVADIHGALAQSPCGQALALSSKIAPLVTGEIGALTVATKPVQLPDLAFQDAGGSPRKLSDWKGRTVLLNLWATWCVPCRKEMPALDNLQGKLGSKNFEVVAVNIDTSGPDKPKAFLKDGNLSRLGFFADQKAKVFQLKSAGLALGMPTSVLIDGDGCEIAAISGGAGWDSDEAIKLITAATVP
jgi:thiol-disulfide isomerase/thioredoxin